MDKQTFPPFSLTRLLRTVFAPKPGERIGIFIDLPDPKEVKNFAFLKNSKLTIQSYAHEVFYQGLKNGGLAELNLVGGDFFAYQTTGGSNLDLPKTAFDPEGSELDLERDIFPKYDRRSRSCATARKPKKAMAYAAVQSPMSPICPRAKFISCQPARKGLFPCATRMARLA
jgi:hypothetical protein